ncbi:MAG: hypothetical protein AAF674_16860 [Pseudomonadota bacterium]
MNVIGIDFAKTQCGVAMGDGSGPPRTTSVQFRQPTRGKVFVAFQDWLRDLILTEQPGLVMCEAALLHVDKHRGPDTARMMVGLSAHAESVCARRSVLQRDVQSQTWRKAFLGTGRPTDPKQASLRQCELLGWPTGGIHDRAEAAGVWAYAHIHHGNSRGVMQMLSMGSVKRFAQ